MKRILTLIVTLAAFAAAGSSVEAQDLKGLVKKATESSKPQAQLDAKSQGKAAGIALKDLFAQYKADGKLKVTNKKNVKNITILATNLKGLKGQSSKSTFYKEFAAGLILGSENLVNDNNVNDVMKPLTTISNMDVSPLTSKGELTADSIEAKADVINEIIDVLDQIFKLFE